MDFQASFLMYFWGAQDLPWTSFLELERLVVGSEKCFTERRVTGNMQKQLSEE